MFKNYYSMEGERAQRVLAQMVPDPNVDLLRYNDYNTSTVPIEKNFAHRYYVVGTMQFFMEQSLLERSLIP